ncbi:MAG: thiamine phosphate synthase [Acidobacteria bacterium]|nr:thiamine phosphate synthase [Acidobacteriota bacterium]
MQLGTCNLQLPRVYPITDTQISGLSHYEQVKRLIDGGATFIQLRDKHASTRAFLEQAVECVAYARLRGVRIVVNDRADIALMADADGVHLGQCDMPPEAARSLLGPKKVIGYSTHSVEQATRAAVLGVNYIAIGPIFQTRTKQDVDPAVGLDGIPAVKSVLGEIPLVAIGGIDIENIRDVWNAGADSAAVISGLLSDPSGIAEATRTLLNAASV